MLDFYWKHHVWSTIKCMCIWESVWWLAFSSCSNTLTEVTCVTEIWSQDMYWERKVYAEVWSNYSILTKQLLQVTLCLIYHRKPLTHPSVIKICVFVFIQQGCMKFKVISNDLCIIMSLLLFLFIIRLYFFLKNLKNMYYIFPSFSAN